MVVRGGEEEEGRTYLQRALLLCKQRRLDRLLYLRVTCPYVFSMVVGAQLHPRHQRDRRDHAAQDEDELGTMDVAVGPRLHLGIAREAHRRKLRTSGGGVHEVKHTRCARVRTGWALKDASPV